MNASTIRRTTIGLTAVAALALGVTACGDSGKSAAPAPAPAASSSAAAPVATGGTTAAGASAVSVDGKPVTAKFDTTCAKQGGVLALALTDTANSTYGNLAVSATVAGGGTVQAVGITGSKGGSTGMPYAVGYGKGQPGGSAKVEVSGNTYHITGEGVGAPDMSNPMAGAKNSRFDITFACSSVIGG